MLRERYLSPDVDALPRGDCRMRVGYKFWTHVMGFFLLPILSFGQRGSEYPYWYEIPSAPLKFDIPPRDVRYSEMQMPIRSTGGAVRAYSLGCVRMDDGVAVMTEVRRTWRLNQRPEDQLFPINVLRITAMPCSKRSERLAVVKVEYADGGVWQLSPSPARSTPEVR